MFAPGNGPHPIENAMRRIAMALLFVLPLALLYARAGAEIAIGLIDALFLLHCLLARNMAWLRGAFTCAALAWWLWQILASAIGTGGLGLALVAIRLPLLALALRHWLLTTPDSRRRLQILLTIVVAWIGLECWQQFLLGTNLFGQPRWSDGALTGPFNRPRAGPELILLLFPVLVPIVAHRLDQPSPWSRLGGACLAVLGACTVLLIGQRMPSALLVPGLAVTCLMLPRLRLASAGVVLAGALLLAAMPVIAPPAYDKLVVHTNDQLRHFAASPYGEIWVRAANIAAQNPWHGVGVSGFRRVCNDPAYRQGLPALGVTTQDARAASEACNIHPHNYYLEAADDGGVPLLVLFTAMAAAAIGILSAGLRRKPDKQRAGLLAGAVVAFWPAASTSAFTSMPNSGWIFLLLGLVFAAADAARPTRDQAVPVVI
jgi:O-antigen ligase